MNTKSTTKGLLIEDDERNQKILSCDLHDYLEIACVYKIEVEFMFKDGSNLIGTPVTTSVGKDKKEYLTFNVKDKGSFVSLALLDLKSMQAVELNSYFDKVTFDCE
jgi:Rho-binding antiterminator